MKVILSTIVLLLSFSARAEVLTVEADVILSGQPIQLQNGDVLLVRNGNVNTPITCNGANLPPEQPPAPTCNDRTVIESRAVTVRVNFDPKYNKIACTSYSPDVNVKAALTRVKLEAMKECKNSPCGFKRCEETYSEKDFTLIPRTNRGGQIVECTVSANVTGRTF